MTAYWTHISVRNNSRGLLGGGTAAGVSAVLFFHGLGEFRTKWSELPNPLDVVTVQTDQGTRMILVPNLVQIDSCKHITIEAGESKDLDIAAKFNEDPNCYIAVPENFRHPNLKNPESRLPPGNHVFEAFVEYRGRRRRIGEYVLQNGGTSASADLRVVKHP